MSKFTKMIQSGNVVGEGGMVFKGEVAKMFAMSTTINSGSPFIKRWFPTNTLVLGRTIFHFYPIAIILMIGTLSQVLFLVVQTIMVLMIGKNLWISQVKNFPVHIDFACCLSARFGKIAACIEKFPYFTGSPFMLVQSLKIFIINEGGFALS